MNLPVTPPLLPMLAKRVSELPAKGAWIFEPKWDGFRTVIFRDGDELFIQSRDGKPLDRYFPDLVAALKAQLPAKCVLDGEIVIASDGRLEFDALQMRLHPAASRVKKLAAEIPASVVFFDLLALDDRNLCSASFTERRALLESTLSHIEAPLHITPATQDPDVAGDWFMRFEGAGLDGVMAKGATSTYEPNKRTMLKVKHERDCDCVVAGFRWHKNGHGTLVGSLLLGLYNDADHLEHVGVCASFTNAKRQELVSFLEPYRLKSLEGHPWKEWADPAASGASQGGAKSRSLATARDDIGDGARDDVAERKPGGLSRWSQGKDLSWEPLGAELVVEVAYDHMQGTRFRHTAQFRRWRSDKRPADCTFAQLEIVAPQELAEIFTK